MWYYVLQMEDRLRPPASPETLERERERAAMLEAVQRQHPTEVVAAYHYLVEWNSEFERRAKASGQQESDPLWSKRTAFDEALELLPQVNLEQARAVYVVMAEHPSSSVRLGVAVNLPELTRVDRSFGLMLWDRLIRDRYLGVARAANDQLDGPFSDAEELATAYDRCGLAPNDVQWLLSSYEAASQGINLYIPGEQAFGQVIAASGDPGTHN